MKFWKHTLVSAVAFLGISSTVLYTSCQDDSCLTLHCKNGGSCADGYCRCATGYEGTECEIRANAKFLGFYRGQSRCGNSPVFIDSAIVSDEVVANRVKIYKFSTNKEYFGTVKDNSVLIDDASSQGRIMTVTVENNKLTFYEQLPASDTLNACNFVGSRDTTVKK